MCRYRYYYFGTCGHQQTVLFDFCPNAPSLQEASCESDAAATVDQGKKDVHRSCEQTGSAKGGAGEGACAVDNTGIPSLCSTTITHSVHSTNSSFDTGSASITVEPCVDCSSLPADHPSHSSPSAASSHNMAGLPLFGGTFRHWMYGGTNTAPKQSTADAKVHMSMSNKSSVEAVSFIFLSAKWTKT